VDENATFEPEVLLVGGDGPAQLAPRGVQVTAKVVGHVLGDKIVIGKHRQRTGYRRKNGFRASLTQIQIESIGGTAKKAAVKPKAEAAEKPAPKAAESAAPKAAEAPARTAHPPKGYEEMTVAEISEHVSSWRRPNIEAALEYEQAHAKRKGAIAALESALAEKEAH